MLAFISSKQASTPASVDARACASSSFRLLPPDRVSADDQVSPLRLDDGRASTDNSSGGASWLLFGSSVAGPCLMSSVAAVAGSCLGSSLAALQALMASLLCCFSCARISSGVGIANGGSKLHGPIMSHPLLAALSTSSPEDSDEDTACMDGFSPAAVEPSKAFEAFKGLGKD